jgi:hypothetical protein
LSPRSRANLAPENVATIPVLDTGTKVFLGRGSVCDGFAGERGNLEIDIVGLL